MSLHSDLHGPDSSGNLDVFCCMNVEDDDCVVLRATLLYAAYRLYNDLRHSYYSVIQDLQGAFMRHFREGSA